MVSADHAQGIIANFDIKIEERNQFSIRRNARHHGRPLFRLVQHRPDGIFQTELSTESAHYGERFSVGPPIRATHAFQHLAGRATTEGNAGEGADVLSGQSESHRGLRDQAASPPFTPTSTTSRTGSYGRTRAGNTRCASAGSTPTMCTSMG